MKLTADVAKLLRNYLAGRFPGKNSVLRVRIDRWLVTNGYSNHPRLVVICREGREDDVKAAIIDHYGANIDAKGLVNGSFFVEISSCKPMDDFDGWAATQIGKTLTEVQDPPDGKPFNMVYLVDENGKFKGHTTVALYKKMTRK